MMRRGHSDSETPSPGSGFPVTATSPASKVIGLTIGIRYPAPCRADPTGRAWRRPGWDEVGRQRVAGKTVPVDEQHPIAVSSQQHGRRRPGATGPDDDHVEHSWNLARPVCEFDGETAPPVDLPAVRGPWTRMTSATTSPPGRSWPGIPHVTCSECRTAPWFAPSRTFRDGRAGDQACGRAGCPPCVRP
jgi:hypothetical protein